MTVFKVALWVVVFISLLQTGFAMLSTPSMIENIIGFFILVAIAVVSIKTKCFTSINFKKKKKDEESI